MRSDVREAIELCKSVGLDPVLEGGQYKVRNPDGVLLFNFHRTPSDTNWLWNIRRFLRQLGLLRQGNEPTGYKRHKKSGNVKRGAPAIDLVALKRAQDQAAAHGERIPTLEDFDGTTEFFKKIKDSVSTTSYSPEAQEEAIDLMIAKADASRINYIKQRLRKLLDEKSDKLEQIGRERAMAERGHTRGLTPGKGARAEFVRIAINEVGPKRGIRAWKSEASGQQTISRFLDDDKAGLQVWAADLVDATIDHLMGLKWGEIDESRKLPSLAEVEKAPIVDIPPMVERKEPVEDRDLEREPDDAFTRAAKDMAQTTDAVEEEIARLVTEPEIVVSNNLRERYADALLEILIANKEYGDLDLEPLLSRLDKLVGIA